MPDTIRPMGQSHEPGYDVLRAIRTIVRRISQHSRLLTREAGLSLPQLLSLKAIAELEADEVTLGAISKHVHLSPATVSRIVDRLVDGGLVTRVRSGKDRRRVVLALTEGGRGRYETLPTPLQEEFLKRLAGLPPHERAAIQAALDQVIVLMDAQDADCAPMLASGAASPPAPGGRRAWSR